MKFIAGWGFPETREEAKAWQGAVRVIALDRTVLAVAILRIEARWKAFIGSVPGENHAWEWPSVRDSGSTLPAAVARAIFTEFEEIPYAQ